MASASRAAAQETMAANSARVVELQSGFKGVVNRGREALWSGGPLPGARSSLGASQGALNDAKQAETLAKVAAAEKQAAGAAAKATKDAKALRATQIGVAGLAGSGAGNANTVVLEHPGGNAATAVWRSTTQELHGLWVWNDDPSGSQAASIGAHIQAQPIPSVP